jgi:D-tyrosyl-tRNA(Tyr) deacylase
MRVVLQRVSQASVVIDGKPVADIQKGIDWLVNKICNIRIFADENKVMNLSVLDTQGDIIVVSQFTLHAATKKGNRPSYIKASKPEIAIPLYKSFVDKLQFMLGKNIQTGVFGADMKVSLINDGPVTIVMDSKNKE